MRTWSGPEIVVASQTCATIDTPRVVRPGFKLLDDYRRTDQRQFAQKAFRLFLEQLDTDHTGFAHYGIALTLYHAPFIPVPASLGGSASNASARAVTGALELGSIPGAASLARNIAAGDIPDGQINLMLAALWERSRDTCTRLESLDAIAAIALTRGRMADLNRAATRLLAAGDSARAYRWLAFVDAARADRIATANDLAKMINTLHGAVLKDLVADVSTLQTATGDSASMRKFWGELARTSGTTWQDRAAEHYVRLTEAYKRFRQTATGRGAHASDVMVPKDSLPFDDRGTIYVRHGEPDTVLRMTGANFRPAEAWIYNSNTAGVHVFTFVMLPGTPGMILVDDPLMAVDWDVFGFGMLSNLTTVDTVQAMYLAKQNVFLDLSDWFSRLMRFDARYARLATHMSVLDSRSHLADAAGVMEKVHETNVHMLALSSILHEELGRALSTENGSRKYQRTLPIAVETYRFRNNRMQPELVAVYIIRGDSFQTTAHGRFFTFTDDSAALASDTMIVVPARQAARVAVTTQSSSQTQNWTLRVEHNDAVGAVLSGTAVFDTSALAISDIVLAEPHEGGSLRRAGHSIGALPGAELRVGNDFGLYYELYGVPAGEYRVTISIDALVTGVFDKLAKAFGKDRMHMKISFSGQADGSVAQRFFQVIKPELAPGAYNLRISVHSAEANVSSQRHVLIIP